MNKIVVKIAMAEKPKDLPPDQTPEEIVRGWVEDIDSGRDSRVQWECVRRLFNKLALKKDLSERGYRLLKLMEPMIKKFGDQDPHGAELRAVYPCEEDGGSHEE